MGEGHGYFGYLQRHFDRLETTTPDILARELDFYAFATRPFTGVVSGTSTWDDNGDDVIEDEWGNWDNASAAAGTPTVTSDQLGSLGIPSWCPQPPDPAGPGSSVGQAWSAESGPHGYRVAAAKVVARWDVAGGLTFTAD